MKYYAMNAQSKSFILSTLLFILTLGVNAQEKTGYIQLSAGPAISTGDFGETDFDAAATAGYADNGLSIQLEGGYQLVGNFGLAGQFLYGRHYTRIDDLIFKTDEDIWSMNAIGIGPMYSYAEGKITLDAHMILNYFSVTAPLYLTDRQNTSRTAGFSIGGNIHYLLNDNFSVGINPSFLGTTADFQEDGFDQRVRALTINGSIRYLF